MAKKKAKAVATKKVLEITCKGAGVVGLPLLIPIQGELKTLSEVDYGRLKNDMIRNGFSEPVSVWSDKKSGKLYILNGHQRVATLNKMKAEGWVIPQIPVSMVEAHNYKHAKRKVLALTSQFGKMTEKGLEEFLKDCDVSLDELATDFRFPDLDIPDFVAKHSLADDEGDISKQSTENDAEEPGRTHSAGVRMVQLFFNEDSHYKFTSRIAKLCEIYGVDNVTDAVSKAIEESYEKHQT